MSQERLEGEPGQVGTRTRLLHKMGRREVEMLETVTRRDLPEVFIATYEAKGVWNEANNRFSEQGTNRTNWVMDTCWARKRRWSMSAAWGSHATATHAPVMSYWKRIELRFAV